MNRLMTGTPQLGRVVAVAGAAVLAVSIFLPWYSVAITSGGAAYAQAALTDAAQRYGNATLQADANTIGTSFTSVAGHQVATVTAHQLLKTISIVLLILAALAFVGALMWLAEIEEPLEVDGGQVAAVGALAFLFVLFRMVDRPSVAFFSLSLSWGIWLALLSSAAVVVGGLTGRAPKQRPVQTAFAPVGYSRRS